MQNFNFSLDGFDLEALAAPNFVAAYTVAHLHHCILSQKRRPGG